MIRQLRARHRFVWPILTLLLIVLFGLALLNREPTSADPESFNAIQFDGRGVR